MTEAEMEVAERLLLECLKAGDLRALPHAPLPAPVIAERLEDELDADDAGDPVAIEAEIRKPVPLLEFPWGTLELRMIEPDEDAPAGLEATVYVHETFKDIDLLSTLSETLPGELVEFLSSSDDRAVISALPEDPEEDEGPEVVTFSSHSEGGWASGALIFWFDGELAPIEKQREQVGLSLGELIYNLGDLIRECIADINDPKSAVKHRWSPAWRVKGATNADADILERAAHKR
ncbi:hypothetical protein QZM25_28275 [Burkholderia contaminans]|uniref:hypothetical protein n=1 Tax=Burkholderia cepacia complex TaxID=87882 RepID=UPI001CF43383|nr:MULTISPECIES: hypothetical protein [Burkholderia cepacia complex]MCA7889762.1 hypothetical protein [Burkholderia contaminans]MDN7576514.1 hypothetical protein [Burkholderia contaminans]MDN7670664.1 hypothetical protein [Burkholderia vietnamiensis]